MKNIKRIALFICGIISTIIIGLVIHNLALTAKYKSPFTNNTLSEKEGEEIKFILDLQSKHGNKIWPGFQNADIPILFYNNAYEFVASSINPGLTWHLAKNQPFTLRKLYSRKAENPQAFAVQLGNQWGGSIGIYQQMNRDMILGIRSQTPTVASHLIPFFLFLISPDMHISSTVHEMFHAYQASSNEEKFHTAENSHSLLKQYPYEDSTFANCWNTEGYYLEQALYVNDKQQMIAYIDSFLNLRSERRKAAGMSPELIAAEKQLEWLEGLAKYAESKAYIVASSMETEIRFKEKQPYWELERKQQLPKLGLADGDNRFYHSGAAQAFILDRLNPEWKTHMMKEGIYLEDLIHGKFSYL